VSDAVVVVDAVVSSDTLRMRARVEPGSRLLTGHFPGEPVVPGVAHLHMVLEGVQRLSGRPMCLTELSGFRLRRKLPLGDDCDVHVSRGPEPGTFRFEVRTAEGVASSGALRATSVG
jgi:3-hydroxymyristoyl/3-hydroxydecanoyl-(acyl carrier protein) dehydratase